MNIDKSKRNFWLLFWGKMVSQLGDGIFTIAIPWMILSITNSAIAMSIYLVIQNLSCGLGLIIFGKKIDVWKKEKVMYVTDFIRGCYLFFLFILAMEDSDNILIYIYTGAIILNLCAAAFNPASMSIIPTILNKNDLVKGNSILSIADNTISILGLIMGVTVYEILGTKYIFGVTGLAYVCSAVSEMFIKPQYSNNTSEDQKEKESGLLIGGQYLKNHRNILFIIIFALTWNYIYISLYSVYIPYLFNIIFSNNISSVGIIEMAEGVGLIIGAMLASQIDIKQNIYKSLTKVVVVQLPLFLGFTIAILINNLISFDSFILVAYTIILFILGITVAIVNVNVNVIIQSETSANYIGRVSAIKSLGSMITMALGLLVGGIIIDNIRYEYAFALNSVLFLLLTMYMVNNFGNYSCNNT